MRSTRFATTFAAAIASALFPAASWSQLPEWPNKPVRLVIGIAAGSGSDLLARGIAQRMQKQWNQPVVVENRPGANTIIATESVAKSAPDGYSLLFALDHAFTTTPHLYSKTPYDPVKDFTPITLLAEFGTVLVTNASIPVQDARQLISHAKANPGKITYGSIGSGSQMHLITEMLNNKAGVQLVHVPYKGMPQLSTAVLTGEINATWLGLFSARPHLKSGKIRALAYSGTKRSSFMPELPTFPELGLPEVSKLVWYGLMGPARMPRPLAERIHGDISKLLADPEFKAEEITSKGYEAGGSGLDEFAARIRKELAEGAAMVKISGAKVE